MNKKIETNDLIALSSSLENDEFGAAVRLLSRIVTTGKPVPTARARIVAQMDEDRWQSVENAILENFLIENGAISHPALDRARLPETETPGTGKRASMTGDMPIVHPTRNIQVPTYREHSSPERVSMKRTAFNLIIDIFSRSEQSSNTARAVLGSLLKNWPEGDVYKALSEADKQEFLVEPRSWIVAYLKKNSQPIVAARSRYNTLPPPERRATRQIATPENVGVSETTARMIRERNAGLRINLDVEEDN